MLNAARPASVAGFGGLEGITACAICIQCDPTIAPTLSGVGLAPARNCILGVIMLINSYVSLFTHAGSFSNSLPPRSGCVILTRSSTKLASNFPIQSSIKFNDVNRWLLIHRIKRHSLRHCCRMLVSQMPIRFCRQDTAVLVSEPSTNRFEIHASLDCVGTEKMSQRVMSEPGQPRSLTR